MSTEIESKHINTSEGIHEKDVDGYRSSDVELPIDAQVETYVSNFPYFFGFMIRTPLADLLVIS